MLVGLLRGLGRERRTRSALVGTLAAVVSRPWAVVLQAVAVPLLLAHLGPARYGLLEAVLPGAAWIGVVGGSLNIGLLNGLIGCNSSGDARGADRLLVSAGLPMLLAGAAIIAFGLLLVPLLDWTALTLLVQAPSPRDFGDAVAGVVIVAGIGVLASVPNAACTARQETHKNAAWDALGRLGALGACYWVVTAGLGLTAAAVAFAGVPHAFRLVGAAPAGLRFAGRGALTLRHFETKEFVRALRRGGTFLGMQVAFLALFSTDRLLVAWLFGVEETATYSAAGRVFEMAYGALAIAYAPMWPAYGEALRTGDWDWVRRAKRNMTLGGLIAGLALAVLCLAFGASLFELWLGGRLNVATGVILGFATTLILRSWVDNHSIILNAGGVLRPQVPVFAASALVGFALSVSMGALVGPVGIAWGIPVAILMTSAWILPRMVKAQLKVARVP